MRLQLLKDTRAMTISRLLLCTTMVFSVAVQRSLAQNDLNGERVASATSVRLKWEIDNRARKDDADVDFGRPKEGDRVMRTDHGGKVNDKDFQLVAVDAPQVNELRQRGRFWPTRPAMAGPIKTVS